MSPEVPPSLQNRVRFAEAPNAASAERALKNVRYVVAAVNDSALKVWADLWQELKPAVAANGAVMPAAEGGIRPTCGWPEFLEKLWLLKHYLDYVHNFVK